MGSCKSILYYEEDEDDKKIREKAEQVANDLKEFQSKLKKQRGFSESMPQYEAYNRRQSEISCKTTQILN